MTFYKMLKLICVLIILGVSDSANILGIFNHPGASHTVLGKVLLKGLANRGHNITMISAFPLEKPVPNYRDINLVGFLDDMKRRLSRYSPDAPQGGLADLKNMSMQHTEDTFRIPEVQALIKSNETFDVVIIDHFFNEATWIFGHIFQAPIIISSSFGNNALLNSMTGNTLPFSYVPGAGLPTSDNISLKHRTILAIFNLFLDVYTPRRYKQHHELLQKFFDNPPTVEELEENIALILSNSHFSIEAPRPYTPNIIPIGGMHVEEPKTLPKDLKQYLDSAHNGLIYFSLGSQINSSIFDIQRLHGIIDALGRTNQKVLWKYESDDLKNLPKNIKIEKWIPQTSVLAHPNVKLFITHGGMLSMIESIHFGVPMICIPFNGDQLTNGEFIESRELGSKSSINDLTEEKFYKMITEILTNPKYQKKAKFFSSLLRDQPLSPLDNAMYWVEHVIKHKTGYHLRTYATKLPFYKYYMLDVIGLVLLVLFIIYQVVKRVLKLSFRAICYLCRRNKVKVA